jgi:hypothetical protein
MRVVLEIDVNADAEDFDGKIKKNIFTASVDIRRFKGNYHFIELLQLKGAK